MRVERVNLDELSAKSLDLGFVGEQNHTKIIISCVMMFSDYPDAVATMVVNPPVGDIYPVQLTRSGNKLEWNVSASDLAYAGSGSYQLTFTENEEIIKVEYGSYFVKPSMTSTGEPPTPIEDWMQEATGALEALEEISASASTLAAGSSATAQITTVEGHKNIAIGIPKGDKGDTGDTGAEGYSPTATVSKSGTTATITITDKTGTTTATVTDGVATDAQVTNAVDTYLAANFSNPSNPPLDRTLASSSSAAPADLMGDLSKAVDKTAYSETIDYTTSNVTSYYISPSDGYWKNSSGYCCGFYPVPENAYKVRVEANANYNGVIALLKSTDHTKNTLPDYATGESGLRMTSTGTTAEYAIPDDCGYIYVYLYNASGANNRRPTSTKIFYFVKAQQIDNTLMVEGDAADAKAAGQAIKNVRSLSEDTLSFTVSNEDKGINWKTGAEYNADGMAATNPVDISAYKSIIYRQIHSALTTRPTHGMAFYDENNVYITGINSYYTEDGPSGYVNNIAKVPNGAKYAKFTFRKDTTTYGDFYVKGENELKNNIEEMIEKTTKDDTGDCKWIAGIVGMTQKTNGKFNVATRMRMLCDIEWKPKARVPKQIRSGDTITYGSFEENITQTGIPYGAQLTYEQWIGKNISFETFLSALANQNSVMYDFSRVGTAYRQSAWYSVNCSKAVAWALNLPNVYASGTFSSDPHISKIANAGEYSASEIQIGDIIEKPGYHTAIVTDLVYNSFGDLSQIEVSEAITPTCRRKRWNLYGSFDSFWIQFDGYKLLRYEYVDSVPPVNMESMYPYISPSVGLNYGNKSNYQTTDTIEITILHKVSNTLNVKKDGTLLETIDVTDYKQLSVVTYTQSTAGWYEIGFDGDEAKNYVGFCVNDNEATLDTETNIITFSSTKSTLYMISYSTGSSRSHLSDVFPTATDLTNGYMTLTIPNSANYIHATFANDYGKTIIEIAIS